ncbi:MAG TPA: hypothetical protein DCL61_04740, partial [Cyanobacteria bacterium UBA12227]|nr:hypothetical protein [Cyanobacteria bacterium UBA12227]
NPKLQSEIDSRCPCFAVPASECNCKAVSNPAFTLGFLKKSDYEQMVEAIQNANSWLQHAYQLMVSQGITDESVDSNWPIHLADAVHYCGEALSELDPE